MSQTLCFRTCSIGILNKLRLDYGQISNKRRILKQLLEGDTYYRAVLIWGPALIRENTVSTSNLIFIQ